MKWKEFNAGFEYQILNDCGVENNINFIVQEILIPFRKIWSPDEDLDISNSLNWKPKCYTNETF